jgi:transcriptional regulator with XRE-family HTH domain
VGLAPKAQGELIRACRRARGMTQAQLAAIIGRDRSIVSRWESGTIAPRVDDLRTLAGIFHTPLSMLIDPPEVTPALRRQLHEAASRES